LDVANERVSKLTDENKTVQEALEKTSKQSNQLNNELQLVKIGQRQLSASER
jgi:hypothetical protein